MVEGLCATCKRTVYVSDNSELFCPVCSAPLVAVEVDGEKGSESEAI